ncbi:MAG: hypothetical protein CMD33_02080 [Flavobacteriales bacterium]|nr:hypothetical protein [Flavobacteriales bacterium]
MRIALQSTLLSFLLVLVSTLAAAQETAGSGLPFNPDSDNSGAIDVTDLLNFLPYYGEDFVPTGVIPVALGGTGSSTVAAARDSLGLSALQDTTIGAENYVWIHTSLRIQEEFAQGFSVAANGLYAHASGTNTNASGAYSNAQNRLTTASATCSSAQGEGTTASGTASHAEGMLSQATALTAHAEGYGTDATANYSHAEGYNNLASSTAAHAEGYSTDATGLYSHAEGRQTEASGSASHAEGQTTVASGDLSHAEGFQSVAEGYASHAGGFASSATGLYSRAAGRNSTSVGTASFATGYGIVADQEYGTAIGQFNALQTEGALFMVGNGTDTNMRSNAFEVHNSGNVIVHGDAVIEGTVFSGTYNVASTLGSLISTVDSMQIVIAELQAQVEALTEGE